MQPERRSRLIRLLAQIDQLIAECEELIIESELDPDEALSVAASLQFNREARERVETLLNRN